MAIEENIIIALDVSTEVEARKIRLIFSYLPCVVPGLFKR